MLFIYIYFKGSKAYQAQLSISFKKKLELVATNIKNDKLTTYYNCEQTNRKNLFLQSVNYDSYFCFSIVLFLFSYFKAYTVEPL